MGRGRKLGQYPGVRRWKCIYCNTTSSACWILHLGGQDVLVGFFVPYGYLHALTKLFFLTLIFYDKFTENPRSYYKHSFCEACSTEFSYDSAYCKMNLTECSSFEATSCQWLGHWHLCDSLCSSMCWPLLGRDSLSKLHSVTHWHSSMTRSSL